MNLYLKVNNKWFIEDKNKQLRYLYWWEWIELRYLQLRDWFHLLKERK